MSRMHAVLWPVCIFHPNCWKLTENFKGAIPLARHFSELAPPLFFLVEEKLTHLRCLFLKQKIIRQKLTLKNKCLKT